LLLAAVCAQCAAGQSPALNSADSNTRHVDATKFGERVALGPNWLFAPGDNPAWASPTFDDSGWQTITTDKELLAYGIHDIPYAWYRLHIHLRPGTRNLAVALYQTFGSYEVYINGVRVGSNGNMAGRVVFFQRALAAYSVPDNLLTPQGDLVLALRFSVDVSGNRGRGTSMPLRTINAGANSAVYLLSRDEAPRDVSYANAHNTYDDLLLGGLSLLAGLVALALYLALRSQREYLAAAVYLLASAGSWAVYLWLDFHAYTLPGYWLDGLTIGTAYVAITEFVRRVLSRPSSRWLLALQCAVFVAAFGIVLQVSGLGGSNLFALLTRYLPILAVDILLLVMLVRAWLRGNREARVLLPAVIVQCFGQFWTFLDLLAFYLHIIANLHPLPAIYLGSYRFPFADLENLIFFVTMLLFLVLRTVTIARERAQAAAELEAARTVQQILIPEEIPTIPSFVIHSVYKPAGDVGGDFFQILPTKNGGVLAVIGDVSGKGMPAAMTVSLLVGTFRTLAHFTENPGEILAAMNFRMLGRSHGGFTTCLVLHADPAGQLTIANAGHIAPYVDSKELSIENGLPLGLAADTTYNESTFQLGPGQQLTLVTDGVVEARDKSGALFGFERTASISNQSTDQIAATAQLFGQDDDITVLTLALAT
jgi:hypothetical protein